MSKDNDNHEHCHNCGHDHDEHHEHHGEEEEMDIIQLTLDDDSTLDCGVIGIFEVEEKDYIALLPLDEDGEDEEAEALLYEYKDLGDDEFDLALIEDEDEFNTVVDAFYALFSDGEINHVEEDEEE